MYTVTIYTVTLPSELRGRVREDYMAISSKSQVFYPGELCVLRLYYASPIDSGVLGSQEFKFDITGPIRAHKAP
jgi:hypothetical protein